MKRLFALFAVIASTAVLFSCGGGSSDDDSAKLSGESLTITKAVGQAVSDAVNTALNSIKTAPKMNAAARNVEESSEVNYSNEDKSLVVSGTKTAMDVTMKEYKSESEGHKLVLNGTVKVTLAHDETSETQTINGTINLTYDGAAHTIVQDYKTVTNHEKGTYVTTGTVTFDGTESKYEDSGSFGDEHEGEGALVSIANVMVDALGSTSAKALNGSVTSNSSFTFSEPVIDGDTRTLTPKATAFTVELPDKTTMVFTCSDITFKESKPTVQYPNPTVTTYTLTVKNGTVKFGGADYTFACTGTRTETQSSSSPQPTIVEKFSVTVNGQVIPVENTF